MSGLQYKLEAAGPIDDANTRGKMAMANTGKQKSYTLKVKLETVGPKICQYGQCS